jgi:hypothetical protein
MKTTKVQASSLVFYPLPNFAGTATSVSHGDTGLIANNAIIWSQQSVSLLSTDVMRPFIWSRVDTGNPAQSYFGHVESYVNLKIPNLETAYPAPQYALQYLGLDRTQAVPVMVQLADSFAAQNTFAATALVPGTTTTVSTLGLPGQSGALGFVGTISGSATFVSLMFGTFDNASGLVNWRSAGNLTLVYSNGQLALNGATGLPSGWSFSTPVLQTDGHWLMTLSESVHTRVKPMGARTLRTPSASSTYSMLTALAPDTGLPIEASWRYENESITRTGIYFFDTQPEKLLDVAVQESTVTLSPCNFGVSEDIAILSSAIVARCDDGTVMTWGDEACGGDVPTSDRNHNIVGQTGNSGAMCALNAAGQVFAWGMSEAGGTLPDPINAVSDIILLKGGGSCMLGLRNTHQVIAWGYGETPAEISALTNVIDVQSSGDAQAVLLDDGTVRAWGGTGEGGTVPPEVASLSDITELYGSYDSFAVRRANGQRVCWGQVPPMPPSIAALTDIVQLETLYNVSAAALKSNGQVIAWGEAEYGGTVPADIAALTDIVLLCGNGWVNPYTEAMGFAVLRANGQVMSWGSQYSVPQDIASLTDIISLVGCDGAYAILRANGQVMTWGDPAWGGSLPPNIAVLTNVRAIYSSCYGFLALTEDSTVMPWGYSSSGEIFNVPAALQGNISYEYKG